MNSLTYESLSTKERDFLTDDCGNTFLNVPDFVFEEACRRHDFGYWLGGNEQDRYNVDARWLNDMKATISQQPWYRRWYLLSAAYVYYYTVRAFSGRFFHYGDKRTREDLEAQMIKGVKE